MIPAAKNPLVERWFRGYVRRYLRRSFHRVLLLGDLPRAPEGPLLVCVNHSSWWDLLLGFWLSREVLGWDSYGPMDQRQLRRYPIFTRLGVFGVDRESLQGGREFVSYATTLLAGSRRALWITAQGAIVSNSRRPVRYYSGVAHLARALAPCHVLTVALDYEFWDEKLPEAFVSVGPMVTIDSDPRSRGELLHQLERTMEDQLDGLAEARVRRDPREFRELLRGGGSVSPVYDALRRLTSRGRGETFNPEHGALATPPRWGPERRR